MHCPQCGTKIESDKLNYCTRCGQMLDRIRLAMSEELAVARGTVVSRSGLNLGVALMYIGLWPSLLAILLTSSAIPLAFLMLSLALGAIVFGSGSLLRLFQTDEIHPEVERSRRKEIAFGSTLMYIGSIIATLFVAVGVPDSWVRIMLIGSISAVFGILLAASKLLYTAYRDLASNEPVMLTGKKTGDRELATSTLDPVAVDLQMPGSIADRENADLVPHSVTDGTTRSLDEWKAELKVKGGK